MDATLKSTPAQATRATVATHAAPVIAVTNLEKTYPDGTQAVKGVTFEVAPGEIFGLLGSNGAGKTTTMRILGTLHSPTAGAARVLDLDVVKDAGAVRARIGFAMQEVGMDALATTEEMLVFHARLHGIPKKVARAKADEMVTLFELAEHRKKRVTSLSGGLQRRLDLAVSLIHDPEVMFLDEPSTGLDPVSRKNLWTTLRRLRDEKGLTILMSTHYMDEADALCDRIAIMDHGEIRAIDTPQRLKQEVGKDRVRLRLKTPADADQEARMRKAFGDADVIVAADAIEVRVENGEESLLPVLREAVDAGLAVAGTRVITPNLDDVFLAHTGSRIQGGTGAPTTNPEVNE